MNANTLELNEIIRQDTSAIEIIFLNKLRESIFVAQGAKDLKSFFLIYEKVVFRSRNRNYLFVFF